MAEDRGPPMRAGHDEEDAPPSVPATADDRKAAAALSSLETRGGVPDDDEGKSDAASSEALGKAMKSLEGGMGAGKGEGKMDVKAVKVAPEDLKEVVSVDCSSWGGALSGLRKCRSKKGLLIELTHGTADGTTGIAKAEGDGPAQRAWRRRCEGDDRVRYCARGVTDVRTETSTC